MFKSIKEFVENRLNFDQNSAPDQAQIQLAAATLLFEVIRADHEIEDAELSRLQSILEQDFDLQTEDVDALTSLAQQTAEDAISLQSFTRTICDNFNNEQRCELIKQCWCIALADGHIDRHERHLIRKLAGLLYLNEKQIIQTRESAKQIMNG